MTNVGGDIVLQLEQNGHEAAWVVESRAFARGIFFHIRTNAQAWHRYDRGTQRAASDFCPKQLERRLDEILVEHF